MEYDPNPILPAYGVLFGVAFVVFYLLILAGVYAVFAWLLSRVFRKAGIPAWKAWVPIYNFWVFLELGGQPGWIAILAVVPFAGIVATVFMCIAAYNVGLAFGKPGALVVLFIFAPWLWFAIVGLDAEPWQPWRSPASPVYGTNVFPPRPPTPGY
ncbi:DUF5684 domain-containing protein [Parafrigoribacterium soli]|uniref:DUF5684 domain-containing protein n=1 Tax=Parafrigoribacterium soli TaxID=3144663 RepID=UPI0032EF1031